MRRLLAAFLLLTCQAPQKAAGRIESGPSTNSAATGRPVPAKAGSSSRARATSSAPAIRRPSELLSWTYATSPLGTTQVVVRIPEGTPPLAGFPILVLLHGRGESLKGPTRGARGWLDDYHLAGIIKRLQHPPLTTGDFGGAVTRQRLARFNARLARQPYRDFVIVMPFVPNRFRRGELFTNGPKMADFIVDTVLPRVQREAFATNNRERIGVDGVSLGGRVALLVGLSRPDAFGTVGATQAAIDESETERLVAGVVAARRVQPLLKLRLLTSHEDYFLDINRALSQALHTAGVPHRLDIISGDHSYEFNRGPGALDLLSFHSRTLWK